MKSLYKSGMSVCSRKRGKFVMPSVRECDDAAVGKKSLFATGKYIILIFALQLLAGDVKGQINLTTTSPVTTNFDGMGSTAAATMPTGFKIGNGSVTYATAGTATTVLGSGSFATGGIYNFGNGTDRSPGFLGSGSYTPGIIFCEVANNTGATITGFTISWNYEKYRSGTRAWAWTFATSATAGGTGVYADPVGGLGNLSYAADATSTVYGTPTSSTGVSCTISGLNITNTSSYYFRWTLTGSGGTSNGQGLGIDDVVITPVFAATGCSGTPNAGTATAGAAGICTGGSTTITLSGATTLTGISYQWKQSSTGVAGSFSNVTGGSGATSLTYTTPTTLSASSTTYYQCVSTCSTGGGTNNSNTVSVTVLTAAPTGLSATATPNPVCSGATLTLSGGATSATTYAWAGPGFTAAASTTTRASITTAGAGVYTLTATNACGSSTLTTASVVVGSAPTSLSITASPSFSVCAGTAFTLTGNATSYTTPTYAWTGPGLSSTSVNPLVRTSVTTTMSGTYVMRAITSCGTTTLSSPTSFTVSPLPAAGAITPANPAVLVGSMISLSNATATGTGVWSATDGTGSATINAAGVATGISIGIATISYAATSAAGCGPVYATKTINVNGPPPVITSFTPQAAAPGSIVTITGSNFDVVPGNNIVYFGATRAVVDAGTSTTLSLSVTVPPGALYAPVSVTTSTQYTAYSDTSFTPIYNNSGFRNDSLVFKNALIMAAGATPYSGAIGDIDGDGKPDLVVNNTASIAGSGTPSISVFKNVMSGTGVISGSSFTLTNTLTGGIGSFTPNNVKLADIDGDGKLDIVVALPDAGYMVVYRNTTTLTGSPTFAANTNVATGQYSSVAAIRDFDGDGKPDVVLASFLAGTNTINVLPNTSSTGSISFGATVYVPAGATPSSVCIADLDGDGVPDVAGVNSGFNLGAGTYAGNTITVARNTSTYGAISFGTSVSLSVGSGPVDIAAGDIDNDGKNDLVVTNINDGKFSVLINTSSPGTLTASSFAGHVDIAAGNTPTGIALSDLNGDGKLDVVVSNNIDNTVSMFRNLVSGSAVTLSLAAPQNFNTGSRPVTVTIGDLDADGYPDVVTGNRGTSAATANTITIIKNYPVPPIGQTSGAAIICAGTTTTFTNTVAGGSWAVSNTTKATITAGGAVTGIAAGVDTVIYYTSFGGDTSFVYTPITVNPAAPVVLASASATTLCTGATLSLSGSVTGIASYSWSGPNGFTSTDLNPSAITIGTASAGIYSLTASNSCGTITATTADIIVNVTPDPTITGTTVIPAGGSTTISIAGNNGDTVYYSWTGGGNLFAVIDASGAYTFTVSPAATTTYTLDSARSSMGCFTIVNGQSATVTIDLGCSAPPSGVAAGLSSAAVCGGSTITLSGTATGGLTYQWDGPGGYLSTDLSPASFTVSTASAGVYTFTATNACGSASATATLTILTVPTAVSASLSGTSICSGQLLTLTAAATGATDYSWQYPDGSTTTDLNPSAITTTTLSAGIYTLTAHNSCGSTIATTTALTINTVPSGVAATASPAALCTGATLTLSGAATDAVSYSWSYPDGGTSTDLNPTGITVSTLSAGIYTLTATNSCGNVQAVTAAVVINSVPTAVSAVASPLTLCAGSTLSLSGSATDATVYSWSGPAGYTATDGTTSFTVGSTAAGGVYTLSAINSCGTVTATTASVTVNGMPSSVSAVVFPGSVCIGNTFTLTGTATSGTSYSWSGPGGYTSTDENPVAITATATSGGIYSLTVSNSCGATNAATSSLIINTVPTGVIATSSATTLCSGQTLTLTGSPAGAISYQWNGPNGYSQTARNPAGFTVNTLSAGIYSFAVTNACGTTTTTTTPIVVNTPPTAVSATATPTLLCAGSTLTLNGTATNATSYTWRGPNAYTASGNPASLTTNSLSGGIYTVSAINGCGTVTATTASVTVDFAPSLTGASSVNTGSTITLSYAPTTGGVWSSSNLAVANVNVSGGAVTGFSAGTTDISYAVTNTCGTNTAVKTITVVAAVTTSGQIYYNSFDAGSLSGSTYNGGSVLAPGVTGGNWTGTSGFSGTAGASGNSISMTGTSNTYTMTMSVQSGYSLSLSSYSLWTRRSNTGPPNFTITVNGTLIGSGSGVSTSGSGSGTLAISPVLSNLTGTITVVINATSGTGGTGTFRVDDFTLNGTLVPGSSAPVVNPYPVSDTIVEHSGTSFSVGAGGAAAYQWQRSTSGIGGPWTNITSASLDATGTYSGYTTTSTATTNTLTLANVPLTWNGYAYRCVVTNTVGSSTSGAAVLTVTVPPPCAGAPVAGTVTPASATFCTSGSNLLTAPAPTAGGITYRWQSSPDNATWSDISGATSNIYATATVTATTYYRSVVTCTNTSDTNITSTSVININPSPVMTVTPSSSAFCTGSSTTTLSATGAGIGGTYSWSPSTGLSSSTGSLVTVTALSAQSLVYTVTGTNTLSCTSTGTATITYPSVNGMSVTPTTSSICAAPGQLLTASANYSSIPTQAFEGNILAEGWTTSGTTTWAPVTLPYTWSTTTISGTGKAYVLDNRSAATTSSQLVSPAFSLADYATASLSYNYFYDQGAATNDSGNVAISTDGGTTWTSLWRAPNSWPGAGTYAMTANSNSINLTPYVGNTNVKVRFGYYKFGAAASWLFFVDNVAISGTAAQSAYTWSPSAGLTTTSNGVLAAPAATTTYTATLAGCVIGTASVTVLPLPTAGSIAASDTNICLGGTESFILSETGTPTGPAGATLASYAWSGPAGYTSTATAAGVGARTITPTVIGQSGVYSLTVTYNKPGCTSLPVTTPVITVNPHPVAYNVTGGNACASPGVTVGLSSSDTGIYYLLYNSLTPVGSAIAGTGTSLNFGLQSAAGIYQIIASGNGACDYSMAGADTVNANPTIALSAAMPNVCQPTTSAPVSFSGSTESPVNYTIDWDATANGAGFTDVTGAALTGTSIPLDMPATGAVGTFNGTLAVTNGTCVSAPYAISTTIQAYPTATITAVDVPCIGHSGAVYITGVPANTISYMVDSGSVINDIVSGAGTFTVNTGVISSPHNYTIVSVGNSVCTTTVDTVVYISPTPMAWIGGSAGHLNDWNYPGNWACNAVPDFSDNVIIDSGAYTPVIDGAAGHATGDLTLLQGASLEINSGTELKVLGTMNSSGKITGDGKVVMNNVTNQAIKGRGTISNLEVDNAGGATVDSLSHLTITNTLYLTSGALVTSDSLELASTDSLSTARIAPIPVMGASISGKVRVDQFITGGYRRYRFFSHPFRDTISLSQINKYVDITGSGGAANGFTPTGSNAPSAFRLDPYTSNSSLGVDPGWKAFTRISGSAADSNRLHPGQGVRFFVRGSKGEGLGYVGYYGMYTPSPVTVKTIGNINQGDVSIRLSQGATSTITQSFNMIGNPYPSPVDMGTALWHAMDAGKITGPVFFLFDPAIGASGNFVSVALGTTAPIPYYVQGNTALQVSAAYDGAVVDFTESNKTASISNYLFKEPVNYVTLSIYDSNYHLFDKMKLDFNEKATTQHDRNMDAVKPTGVDFAFYSISSEGYKLAVDARPFAAERTIPLGVNSATIQNYIIRADNIVVPDGGKLVLHDKLLEKYVDMNQGAEYSFAITKDKATQGTERFELAMKSTAPVAAKGLAVSMTPNPTTDDVKISFTSGKKENVGVRVMDISGISIFTQDLGAQQTGTITVPLSKFVTGIYVVELTQGEQKVTKRVVKE